MNLYGGREIEIKPCVYHALKRSPAKKKNKSSGRRSKSPRSKRSRSPHHSTVKVKQVSELSCFHTRSRSRTLPGVTKECLVCVCVPVLVMGFSRNWSFVFVFCFFCSTKLFMMRSLLIYVQLLKRTLPHYSRGDTFQNSSTVSPRIFQYSIILLSFYSPSPVPPTLSPQPWQLLCSWLLSNVVTSRTLCK